MLKVSRIVGSLAAALLLYVVLPTQAWALCLCPGCTYERCVEFCGRTNQQHFCTYVPPPPPPPPPPPEEKEPADMGLTVAAVMTEANWTSGRLFATYTVTLRNHGDEDAENVELNARLPKVLMAQNISSTRCALPSLGVGEAPRTSGPRPLGGLVRCQWPTLAGGSTTTVRMEIRILNATDFHALQSGEEIQNLQGDPKGVEFEVKSAEDDDATNNEKLANELAIPFIGGSNDGTRLAMEVLAPYFNYVTDERAKTCNHYKLDIYDRLEKIRTEHPEVFANLSYGGITSGGYTIALTGGTAGHVGVVLYTRGSNYRQTGIVIHGTPSPSPLTLYSPFYETQIGTFPVDGQSAVLGWTALNGYYNRTPAHLFPGKVQLEGDGGFEGRYPDNAADFTFGGTSAPAEPVSPPMTCPFAPDAVVVTTESPVEIIATNSRGQRVKTEAGKISELGLATGIHSMAVPHADGTFGWTLVLPRDNYDIQLVGTRAGSYKLTLTTFNAAGEPVNQVTQGTTTPGAIGTYSVNDAPPSGAGDPPADDDNANRGGGGALGWLALLAMLSMLFLPRRPGAV